MLRFYHLIFFIAFLFISSSGVFATDNDSLAQYNAILEQVKKSDTNADFKSLRMLDTETEYYDPYNSNFNVQEFNTILTQKKYQQLINKIEPILWKEFVSIDLHFYAMKAYEGLDNKELQQWHKYIFLGLLNSIIDNGDGKSPQTAFIVINVSEEYSITNYLEYKVKNQSLANFEGHSFDVLEVISKAGKKTQLYFNIDTSMKWMEEQFNF